MLSKSQFTSYRKCNLCRDKGHTDTVDLRAELAEVAGQRRRIPGLSLCTYFCTRLTGQPLEQLENQTEQQCEEKASLQSPCQPAKVVLYACLVKDGCPLLSGSLAEDRQQYLTYWAKKDLPKIKVLVPQWEELGELFYITAEKSLVCDPHPHLSRELTPAKCALLRAVVL